jgi:hypothetical protein
MPSKDKRVISAKISEKEYQQLETYANTHNISISALMSMCIKAVLDGDILIEKGELKFPVDPNGYEVYDEFDTPFGQKLDRKFDRLRERGYPEKYIEQMKEEILNGVESRIDMLPKKYDSRRVRDDCGC